MTPRKEMNLKFESCLKKASGYRMNTEKRVAQMKFDVLLFYSQ